MITFAIMMMLLSANDLRIDYQAETQAINPPAYEQALTDVENFAGFEGGRHLNEPRRMVLISTAFELGTDEFMQLTELQAAIQKQDFNKAAIEFSRIDMPNIAFSRLQTMTQMLAYGEWPGIPVVLL